MNGGEDVDMCQKNMKIKRKNINKKKMRIKNKIYEKK